MAWAGRFATTPRRGSADRAEQALEADLGQEIPQRSARRREVDEHGVSLDEVHRGRAPEAAVVRVVAVVAHHEELPLWHGLRTEEVARVGPAGVDTGIDVDRV